MPGDLFRTGLRFGLSIGVVSAIMWLTKNVRTPLVPHPALTIIVCATLITIFFNRFNLRVLRATLMGGDREAEAVRTSMLAAGRDEFDREVLIKRFSRILEAWGKTEHAHFLTGEKDSYSDGRIKLPLASPRRDRGLADEMGDAGEPPEAARGRRPKGALRRSCASTTSG